jgi:hypothetical protein
MLEMMFSMESSPRLHNEVRIVQWREWINILYIVKVRPVFSSERARHINKPATVRQKKNLVSSPKWVLDTKTDWPTDRQS